MRSLPRRGDRTGVALGGGRTHAVFPSAYPLNACLGALARPAGGQNRGPNVGRNHHLPVPNLVKRGSDQAGVLLLRAIGVKAKLFVEGTCAAITLQYPKRDCVP